MKRLLFLTISFIFITCNVIPQSLFDSLNQNHNERYSDILLKYNDRELNCLVFPPADSSETTGLILIHEEWGLTDWVKSISEQIASEGYLVIVPDLFPGHKKVKDSLMYFMNEDIIRTALLGANTEQIIRDIDECFKYLKAHPFCNGKIAVLGFSWGGTQAFLYLTRNTGLSAGYIFYGTSPKNKKELAKIQSTVYGFYGEYDSWINSSIGDTERKMHKLGKVYHSYIIDGGGHGFMRSGEREGATEDNTKARTAGWKKLMELLNEN